MRLHNWLESLRKWIDGEEDLDEQGQPRARSKWDDFLVSIAREVEETMQRERFTPPGGPTYVPREYVVFLNHEDDSEWQGEKREGLERGLHHVLSERAKELAGENQFQTKSITVELRVDPGLDRGRFRVQHVWDTEAQKTMVKPRKRSDENRVQTPEVEPAEEEATIVRPRTQGEPSFSMRVRRPSAGEDPAGTKVSQFFNDEVTIGRGARQVAVDLKLEGDLEVSRKHATITKRPGGEFTITCHGANPILLDPGREVAANQTADVKPGDKIIICSYELVIQ